LLDLLVLRVPSFGHIEFHAHWDAERRDRPFLANDAEKALGNLHVVRFHAAGDL